MGNLIRGLLRTTTPDVNTLGLNESDQALLPQFVQVAKQHVKPFPFLYPRNLQSTSTSLLCYLSEAGGVRDFSPPR